MEAAEPMFPAASYARAPMMYPPLVYPVVSHEKAAGALKLVPAQTPSRYHSTRATPILSVAVTSIATIPDTVLLALGEVIVAVGAVVSGGVFVNPRALRTAFRALTRPQPKLGAQAGAPWSSAVCLRMSRTCAPVRSG